MTREEAIIDLKAKITRIKSILDDGLCANPDRWAIKLKWHEDMLSALHSPQPDPITGLVPCGCAGKPEYHSSKYGYVASIKMHAECPDCHAKTAEYYAFLYSDDALEVLQRRVMDAWNTMRGYKK